MKTRSRLRDLGTAPRHASLARHPAGACRRRALPRCSSCKPPKMRAVDATKRFEATPAPRRARPLHRRGGGALHALPLRPRLEDARRAGAAGAGGRGLGRPLGRQPHAGPVFAPNLTPDPETGLGAIPDDAVARAIREGVSHDGRALFMMPWQNYSQLSDEDVASVVAYLRTLPPVKKARGTTAIKPPVSWFLKLQAAPMTAPMRRTQPIRPPIRSRADGSWPRSVSAKLPHAGRCAPPAAARHGLRGRAGVHDRRRPLPLRQHHARPVGDLPLRRGAVHPRRCAPATSAAAGWRRSCPGRRSAS